MIFRTNYRKALTSALFVASLAGAPALAQETTTDAAETPPLGTPFVVATHGDWEVMCNQINEAGILNCEMYQLLFDPNEQPIAEITIAALPFGSEFSGGATITTPLETFLPTGMGWSIGEAEDMRVEGFRVCTVVGCVVRMGLTPEEIDEMRAGANATILIAPFVAIDQPVPINVSLSGFTAAYEELQVRLSEAAAAAREAAAASE